MSHKISSIIKNTLVQIVFISYSITIIAALIVMVVTPFRTGKDVSRGILILPNSFTLDNFVTIWKGGLNIGFRNSLFFGIVTCIITIIVGGLAAYGFAFLKFKWRNGLFTFMFSGIFISIVLIVLPLFILYRDLKLVNTFTGVILIYVGIRLPFTVYLFRNYFEEFPKQIFEAAKIDGANEFHLFTKIVFPLAKPVAITIVIFNFISVWTDLLIGLLFLQKSQNQTIMIKILNIFYAETNITQVTPLAQGFAGLLINVLPVIIIYFFTKKYYIEGLTLGSVK